MAPHNRQLQTSVLAGTGGTLKLVFTVLVAHCVGFSHQQTCYAVVNKPKMATEKLTMVSIIWGVLVWMHGLKEFSHLLAPFADPMKCGVHQTLWSYS